MTLIAKLGHKLPNICELAVSICLPPGCYSFIQIFNFYIMWQAYDKPQPASFNNLTAMSNGHETL